MEAMTPVRELARLSMAMTYSLRAGLDWYKTGMDEAIDIDRDIECAWRLHVGLPPPSTPQYHMRAEC